MKFTYALRVEAKERITHVHVSELLRQAHNRGFTDERLLNLIRGAHTIIKDKPAALTNCRIRITDKDLEAEVVCGDGANVFEIWDASGKPESQQMGESWHMFFKNAYLSIWECTRESFKKMLAKLPVTVVCWMLTAIGTKAAGRLLSLDK